MINTLDLLIENYVQIQKKEDEIKQQKEDLRKLILAEMETNDIKSFTTVSGNSATIAYKDNIKYTDEFAIIEYLREHDYKEFISTKINTTELNKQLKKQTKLSEDLSSKFTITQTSALTVK